MGMMLNLLPYDILAEILSRLPVKSLGKFKCVCKSWLCLLSDPTFTKLLQRKVASRGPRVLISSSSGFQSLDCSKVSSADESALVNLHFPLQSPYEYISIVGSCSGLVCLTRYATGYYRNFFLWNPSTGICKQLPIFHFSRQINQCIYGFGYDSSTNDYKVFDATSASGQASLSDYNVRILSTKTDSWRAIPNNCSIQCCDVHCDQISQGSLLNGTLYWLSHWWCPHGVRQIISAFDLAEEKFREVPLPNLDTEFLSLASALSILDGCLCLKYFKGHSGMVELWMMTEYGVDSSWEKRFTVTVNDELNGSWLGPLCVTTSAELILINNKNELIKFKPKERTLERLIISRIRQPLSVVVYTESLVSPYAFV